MVYKTGIKRRTVELNSNTQRQIIRCIAVILILCVVAALMFSSAVMMTHCPKHGHDKKAVNSACVACLQVKLAWELFGQLSGVVVVVGVAFSKLSRGNLVHSAYDSALLCLSLVKFKVRLNS